MSCQSTPITTVWTESTSLVPTTTSIIHTSIITPSPQISTSLTTSCLSFRTSSLPTAQLVATKVRHASHETDEGLVIRSSTRSTATHDKRQIPSGLPSNCVSWTISPILSTAIVTPSTSLQTSTIASTTQTVVWVPKETIWGCDGLSSTETASSASTDGETFSSASPSPLSSENTNATSPTETSATTESTSPTGETTSDSSTSAQASTEAAEIIAESAGNGTVLYTTESSSSTRQWIDETARLNSMASSLSAQESTRSANLTATLPTGSSLSTSASGVTTTSEVQIAPVALIPTSSSSSSYFSQASSTHNNHLPTSKSSSADSGAATQGAMAVNDEEGTSKAVSVGATIGGVVGLFAFIALLLMAVRWYMRWKRGNKRKTIKMRQSWYPAGYDGPDHIVPAPIEKNNSRKDRGHHSFFSMNGKNAISGGNDPKRKSKRFPGLNVPQLGLPFFPYPKNNQNLIDHEQDQERRWPPDSAKRLTMPAIFANSLAKMKQGTGFPSLATPWSTRKYEDSNVTPWTEKYEDAPEGIYDGSSVPTQFDQIQRNRDVNPPRSILTRPPGFDGVVGPPKLDYQPAGHTSWGLSRQGQQGELASRPKLEWGHSYAASTANPNPRVSIMPPLPPSFPHAKPFVPGPAVPPSPTEESVYSLSRHSHNGRESRQSRASTRQSKQSFHDRHSNSNHFNPSPAGVNRKPSRTSNPDLRSAILSRASASAASLGNWSTHSGTSEQSLPPLPEGGFKFDFPLPPTPTRTHTPNLSIPSVPLPQTGNSNRNLIPSPGRKPVPNVPQSSVFEYGEYTRESTAEVGPSRSEAGERDTIRQTANWYEKPLWIWDGQSGPLPRIPTDHGRLDGDVWQSRKSVRWDAADGVARAL